MSRPSRGWFSFPQPEQSLLRFPVVIAGLWASVIGLFATVGHVWGPEDERGSWGEVFGAIGGNFVLAFAFSFVISLIVRSQKGRGQD